MRSEEMTPIERMDAFSKGEEIDRIICIPDMGVTMVPFIGVTARDYYHSARLMADLEIALFKKLRQDSVGISTSLRGIAEAMGSKVGYPDYNISYLLEPVVKSVDQIESLKVVNPLKDGKLPILIEALRLTRDALIKEVDVGAAMSGPFSVAASLVGTGISNFSIDNIEDLEDAKEIMGDRVIITGNVPPVDAIYKGTKEDIFKSVKECIRKGHDSKKGYILSTGCQIPMNTPIEKIEMFMEAAKIYGRYPLNLSVEY